MSLGKRLKQLRKQRGLTQGVLAGMVGIKHNAVSMHENDLREPSLVIIQAYAQVLGVRAGWLAFGELPATDKEYKYYIKII